MGFQSTQDEILADTDDVGMGGTLFPARGVLTVKPEGLEYVSKKRTVAIGAASLREVRVVEEASTLCVAVSYDDGGQAKRALFQQGITHADAGLLGRMEASIRAAMRGAKKPE